MDQPSVDEPGHVEDDVRGGLEGQDVDRPAGAQGHRAGVGQGTVAGLEVEGRRGRRGGLRGPGRIEGQPPAPRHDGHGHVADDADRTGGRNSYL